MVMATLPVLATVHTMPLVAVEWPRGFGYLVGDLLEVEASVRVPAGFELEARSVQAQDLPNWLEMREVTWQRQDSRDSVVYRLRWVYQIFFTPPQVTALEVPPRAVRFRSLQSAEPLDVVIPAVQFTMSPLTEPLGETGPLGEMEPDWRMPEPSARWLWTWAVSLGVLLALWGTNVLVRRRYVRRGVFWLALQRVQKAKALEDPEAMLVLHKALEQKAGEAIFSHDLQALFDRWPPALSAREELSRFFEMSEAVFFAAPGGTALGAAGCEAVSPGAPPSAPAGSVPAECLEVAGRLSRRLATLERRTRDGSR